MAQREAVVPSIPPEVAAANATRITEADVARLVSGLDEVRAHVAAVGASAPTVDDPFPHALVSPALPEWLYEMVCRAWPSLDYFGHPRPFRHILDLGDGQGAFTQLPPLLAEFWTRLQTDVLQGILGPSVVRRYAPHFDVSFGRLPGYAPGDWQRLPFEFDRAGLMVHAPGFELKPHVDSVRYCIIYLLYCPVDDAHPEEGTDLYRTATAATPTSLRTTYPELSADVEPAVSLTYRRNSLATFLVTPRSVHGVRIKRLDDRRVINCAVKLPEPLLQQVVAAS